MTAVRQPFERTLGRSSNVVPFENELPHHPHPSSRSHSSRELREAVDLVETTTRILDEILRQNDALEAESFKAVTRFQGEATQARHEADCLRAELNSLRQKTQRREAEVEKHIRNLEIDLDEKNQALAVQGEELATAEQWIEHFRARFSELLLSMATELELRPHPVASPTQADASHPIARRDQEAILAARSRRFEVAAAIASGRHQKSHIS